MLRRELLLSFDYVLDKHDVQRKYRSGYGISVPKLPADNSTQADVCLCVLATTAETSRVVHL